MHRERLSNKYNMKIKEKSINLWMSNKLYVPIKKYSIKHDISLSKAIRRGIELLIKNKNEK